MKLPPPRYQLVLCSLFKQRSNKVSSYYWVLKEQPQWGIFWTSYSRVPCQERAKGLQPEARRDILWWEMGPPNLITKQPDLGKVRGGQGDGEGQHQDQLQITYITPWHRWNYERKNGLIGDSVYKMRESGHGIRLEKMPNVSCTRFQNGRRKGRPSPVGIAIHILSHLSEITFSSVSS